MAGKNKKSKHSKDGEQTPRIVNRRARHDYHIHDTIECGIKLLGTEVKSVRNGQASIAEGFAQVDPKTHELWLINTEIALYSNAPAERQHEPKRKRKLLCHRRELNKLLTQTQAKGMTLVPMAMYFNSRGLIKIEIGLGSGKKHHDKREDIKKRDMKRDMQRAMTRKEL